MDDLLAPDLVSQFNDEMNQRLFPNFAFLLVKLRLTGVWRERHYDLLKALPNVFPRVTTLEIFDLLLYLLRNGATHLLLP